jgi:hypothetical protein
MRCVGARLLVAGGLSILGIACGQGSGELAIYNIEPRTGATTGDQPVRISGANFRQDIGYTVYFGSVRAPRVTILDDSTLVVTTPQHDPGRVDVVVVADDGPAFRIVGGFQFTEQGGGVIERVGDVAPQGEERF